MILTGCNMKDKLHFPWDACMCCESLYFFNTLRPRQNGRHFPDDIYKWIFLNENVWISIKISLKFVPWGPINNISTLVQIMAWRQPGDKPLSKPMMVSLLTHICVTWPQWVNSPQGRLGQWYQATRVDQASLSFGKCSSFQWCNCHYNVIHMLLYVILKKRYFDIFPNACFVGNWYSKGLCLRLC